MIKIIKKCPVDKEFFEKEYIKNNKSTIDIAKEFGYNHTTVWRRLKKYGLIRSISQSNQGINNGQWKDNPKLTTLHEWVFNHKEKRQNCENCNQNKRLDLANISQKYLRDINDYKWLCRSCHMKMDYKLGVRTPRGKNNP